MHSYSRDSFRAFSEYDGYSMLENQKSAIAQEIKQQNDDYNS